MQSTFVIPDLLPKDKVQDILNRLQGLTFRSGKETASGMARDVKSNEQLRVEEVPGLSDELSKVLYGNSVFVGIAMPRAIGNLLVSRCGEGMGYGTHTDAAIMPGGHRSDISFTLFLSDRDSYEGGSLAMETPFGEQNIRLRAGSLVLYPTGELHRVTPVTRGERLVIVGWVQSRIRDALKRQILIDLEIVRRQYLDKIGHDRQADLLLKSSTNLRRLWDE